MFRFQNRLPRLPLPNLHATCRQYLAAVAPFLSEHQRQATQALVEDFENNAGRLLHELLEQIDSTTDKNWMYDFWRDLVLSIRYPLLINVNPCYVYRGKIEATKDTLAALGARLLTATGRFIDMVASEHLPPDVQKDVPRCMSQYKTMFSSDRIPHIRMDQFVTFALTRHIVVLHRNRFFRLNILDVHGQPLPQAELENALQWIIDVADSPTLKDSSIGSVGVMTSANRTDWAVWRSCLAAFDVLNQDSLSLVDSALFVLCLEESAPRDLAELSRMVLHGDGRNRWFDKPIQVILAADGSFGVNTEHTLVDGLTAVRFIDEIHTGLSHDLADDPSTGSTELFNSKNVEEIHWRLPPTIVSAIRTAETDVDTLIGENETRVLSYKRFGKNHIAGNGFSPDVILQLAFQMGCFRRFDRLYSAYESVNTRKYKFGRGSAIRTVTPESLELVTGFDNAASRSDQWALLDLAAHRHVQLIKDCSSGQGFDRHLFALRTLSELSGREHPLFRADATTEILDRVILSTSGLRSPSIGLVGFGPVDPEGYGLGYVIHENHIVVNATSKTRETTLLLECIEKSLNDFGELIEIRRAGSTF